MTTEVLPQAATAATDLVSEVQRVLADSEEPLTLSRIRAHLSAAHRGMELNELAELLQRQVAANVLYQYPKYRSPQDRFWDRGMSVHIVALLHSALAEGPLAWSALRRKLPVYAQVQAQALLEEQLVQGLLHRHPRVGRGSERIGVGPPDPKDYLREELPGLFTRLAALGFTRSQIRLAALELLHEEEWDTVPVPEEHVEAPAAPASEEVPGPMTEVPAATEPLREAPCCP